MKIGNFNTDGFCALAPMAGVADRTFRELCRGYGAAYTVSELVSAKAVSLGDRKSHELLGISELERPVATQLFGSDPETVATAARAAAEYGPDFLDINMGCPAPKVAASGGGALLMKDPVHAAKIVRATVDAVDLPVTVKMRLGVDKGSINVLECAKAAEEGGAKAICIHGRTRTQMYGGEASYDEIKSAKNMLKIPVIANGDITSAEAAKRALEYTGADGIAIGRGAVGNPFIFREIIAALEEKSYEPPTLDEIIDTALRQLKYAIDDKGAAVAIPEARKQIALYLRGFRGAARIRAEINMATTYEDVKKALMIAKASEE